MVMQVSAGEIGLGGGVDRECELKSKPSPEFVQRSEIRMTFIPRRSITPSGAQARFRHSQEGELT